MSHNLTAASTDEAARGGEHRPRQQGRIAQAADSKRRRPRVPKIIRRTALVLAAVAIALAGLAAVVPQKAYAAGTTCRTIYVHSYDDGGTNQPWMYVPVCYNGSTIWVNGHVSPGITTIGPSFGGFTWYGWYNDSSQRWLGVGENYTLSYGFYTDSCLPRWYINASGGVYGHTDNC